MWWIFSGQTRLISFYLFMRSVFLPRICSHTLNCLKYSAYRLPFISTSMLYHLVYFPVLMYYMHIDTPIQTFLGLFYDSYLKKFCTFVHVWFNYHFCTLKVLRVYKFVSPSKMASPWLFSCNILTLMCVHCMSSHFFQ